MKKPLILIADDDSAIRLVLEKKEGAKNTGEKNQNFFSFFISASIKKIIDNKENITA